MQPTGLVVRAVVVFALCVGIACGGGGAQQPAAPAPIPTPTPTPEPTPVVFTLDAEADHYRFSPRLQQLPIAAQLDLTVEPLEIHEIPDNSYAYAVEVWVWPEQTNGDNYTDHGMALSLAWRGESRWLPRSFTPLDRWSDLGGSLELPLGQKTVIRVARHQDALIELSTEELLLRLPDPGGVIHVLTRVVGTRSSFSYVPFAVAASHQSVVAGPCSRGECTR